MTVGCLLHPTHLTRDHYHRIPSTNASLAAIAHDYMEVASHLNVDQGLVTEVKAKFDKLKPLHINKEGRIKEWYGGPIPNSQMKS